MPVISGLRISRRRKPRPLTPPRKERPPAEETPPDAVRPSVYFEWKGALDRALAAFLLVPGLLVMGPLAVLVRLTSRGPAIYRQTRVGRNGVLFSMYKIRTMRHDAEATSGPTWTRPNDPRITPVGRVLRKLHLDELPQLFNVLRGDMSLVGPRPERPEFVHVLSEIVPGYKRRLAVRPGVTGLAQINLPPDTDLASVQRKLILDVEYIEQADLLLDVRMLLCTMVRILGLPGAHAMRMFGVEREVPVLPACEPAAPSPETLARLEGLKNVTPAELVELLKRTRGAGPDGNGASGGNGAAGGNGSARRHGAKAPLGDNGNACAPLSSKKPR